MLCERCHERAATVHLTNIEAAGETTQQHLCKHCFDETTTGKLVASRASPDPKPPIDLVKEEALIVKARLENVRGEDLKITVQGKSLRVIGKLSGDLVPVAGVIEVPEGYEVTRGKATYSGGQLTIVFPKAAGTSKQRPWWKIL